MHITRPALFDYVGGKVDIYGDIDTSQMQFFQLEYGQGLNPTQWFTLGGQQTQFSPDQAGRDLGHDRAGWAVQPAPGASC